MTMTPDSIRRRLLLGAALAAPALGSILAEASTPASWSLAGAGSPASMDCPASGCVAGPDLCVLHAANAHSKQIENSRHRPMHRALMVTPVQSLAAIAHCVEWSSNCARSTVRLVLSYLTKP